MKMSQMWSVEGRLKRFKDAKASLASLLSGESL